MYTLPSRLSSSSASTFLLHYCALEGWKDPSLLDTQKSLFIAPYIATVPFLKTERLDEERVYVCISLHLLAKQKYLCVCVLIRCYLLSQQTDRDGHLFVLLDAIALKDRRAEFAGE